MILSTWLDRPLSVAGRVVVKEETGLVTKLVDFDENLCIIPNVAIHFNREMNKGVEYNPQVDMQPLWSCNKEDTIAKLIAEKLEVNTLFKSYSNINLKAISLESLLLIIHFLLSLS